MESTNDIQKTSSTTGVATSATSFGALLLAFAVVVWKLQYDVCTACIAQQEQEYYCTNYDNCRFFQTHSLLALILIVTHTIPFALIPLTMWIIEQRREHFVGTTKFNATTMHVGLTLMGVALSLEFGYHVTTAWHYRDMFHSLNFGFYFFLISSFCLWANAFGSSQRINVVFAAILLVATALYPVGAMYEDARCKIALYVGLTVTFTMVTLRGMRVLQDSRMLWVPVFSVGVNLFFIVLLKRAEEYSIWNYVHHICHDLFGTEAGMAVFCHIVWDNPRHLRAKAKKRV